MSDFQDKITQSTPKPRPTDLLGEPQGPAVMTIEYTLTAEDAVALFRYEHSQKARTAKGQLSCSLPVLVVLAVVMFVVMGNKLLEAGLPALTFDSWWPVLLFVIYTFFYFFGNTLLERQTVRCLQHNPRFFEKRALAIRPETLTASDPCSCCTYLWQVVEWVIREPEHAFFYLTQTEALTLPKRAFPDARQFEQFVDTARRYHAEARRFVKPEGQV